MDTSDKILEADWNIIKNCSSEIANATACGIDDRLLRGKLFSELCTLRAKYGRLPSILATQADYEDSEQQLSLLKEAYSAACEIYDVKNKAYISSSLVEAYLENENENENESDKLKFWLKTFYANILDYTDDYLEVLADEFKEL